MPYNRLRPTTNQGEQMNIQEKLAAIEQHAAKCLIETRELMVYLTGHPAAAVSFDDIPPLHTSPNWHTPPPLSLDEAKARIRNRRSTAPGTGYVSPADESVDWPEDAA